MSVLVLLGVLAMAVALVTLPKLTGATPVAVLTGSMSPTYPAGSVVIVRPVPTNQVRVGDVVTYQLTSGEPTLVTHRVVGVSANASGGRAFTTRGDANDAADLEPVLAEQVRGRVWYGVPLVGHVSTLLDHSTRSVAVKALAGCFFGYALFQIVLGSRERRYKHVRTA